jgi:hypothetical protein
MSTAEIRPGKIFDSDLAGISSNVFAETHAMAIIVLKVSSIRRPSNIFTDIPPSKVRAPSSAFDNIAH